MNLFELYGVLHIVALNRKDEVLPNGTLQFPIDASWVTEPETTRGFIMSMRTDFFVHLAEA